MLIRYNQLNFYNFGSESQIRCKTHNSAANVNLLQPTQFLQFWQQIPTSLQRTHLLGLALAKSNTSILGRVYCLRVLAQHTREFKKIIHMFFLIQYFLVKIYKDILIKSWFISNPQSL